MWEFFVILRADFSFCWGKICVMKGTQMASAWIYGQMPGSGRLNRPGKEERGEETNRWGD